MEQKKKALGKGLEQLFSTEVLDFDSFENSVMENANESDIREILIDDIRTNPYQPRKTFDEEALQELASSIKIHGVFQPIIVKKSIKGYDLVAGERRLRASKMAGLSTIPAIVRDFTDDEMREIALLENLQRENLTSIELAWAYKGLIDSLNITQDELATRIGKSRSHVTNTLGLLRLPSDVQDMVLDNKISMGHARVLSKMESNEEIENLANKVVSNNISVHELENISANTEIKKKVPVVKKNTTNNINNKYGYLENKLKETLGTRVKISGGKIEIYYGTNEDLNRIVDNMGIRIDEE